jgi:hypothetical protein
MDEKELLQKIQNQVKELIPDTVKQRQEIKEEYTQVMTDLTKGLIDKEALDKALEELTAKSSGLTKEVADQLIKDVNEIGIRIQAIQEIGQSKDTKRKSFRECIEEALKANDMISVEKGEEGEEVRTINFFSKTGAKATPRMTLKAAIDMTTPLSYAEVEIGSPFKTVYDPSMVTIPLNNDTHVVQIFPVMNIKTKYFGILVEYSYTDGSDTKAENTASGKSSVLFKTEEFKVFTIPTHFHISEEQLEDVDYLLDELSRLAPDKINTKFDSKVISATGDGTTDIKGLFVAGNHTAFASATYADTVENATILDLIGKMKLQASLTDFNPNIVMLHPQKIDEIEGLKDLNENSLFNRTVKYDANGNLSFIKGLAVVSSKQMGTNTVFVGSSLAAKIGMRRDMSMIIGLDSDDLTKRMRTVVFGMRAAFGVRQAGAMIYEDDVETTLGIINKA